MFLLLALDTTRRRIPEQTKRPAIRGWSEVAHNGACGPALLDDFGPRAVDMVDMVDMVNVVDVVDAVDAE